MIDDPLTKGLQEKSFRVCLDWGFRRKREGRGGLTLIF